MTRLLSILLPAALLLSCQNPGSEPYVPKEEALPSLDDFAHLMRAHEVALELPKLDWTPSTIAPKVDSVLHEADMALDRLAAQDPATVDFDGAFAAFDRALFPVVQILNQLWLIKETSQDEDLRLACNAEVQKMDGWLVDLSYREDLYLLCDGFRRAYEAGDRPLLVGEDLKLYEDRMRDYRRAGFDLDAAVRTEVADMQKRLSELTNAFDTNITDAAVSLTFTAAQLDGVPESFLASSRLDSGRHEVRVTVTPDYMAVMSNARIEEVRRAVNRARYSVAMDVNGPILDEMVQLRERIAVRLGYDNWADYKIEPKMAATGAIAVAFCEELTAGLQPKFDAEVAVLTRLKREDTGDDGARMNWWDFRYYQNMLMRRDYGVDTEALRVYFALDRVIDGMFDVYQHIFAVRFTAIEPPFRWIEDLRCYLVTDAESGEPLGVFYLDLFPRPGKYNHFAQFDVISGRTEPDGRRRAPVAALVCNFTPGVDGEPPLMSHGEVETIFHEFGHAMHAILSSTRYVSFAGGAVPRDFVEAPSQMFEAWAWDPEVLSAFAVDYRDPKNTLPVEVIERMEEAKNATVGLATRRQMGLALADLRMHLGGVTDAGAVSNAANTECLFPVPEGTNFAAYWGHLTGYDAGYYGYAWADSIAADLATAFEEAPDRFMDQEVGLRLRREIYERGGSRDVREGVRAFLGRESDNRAFLRTLGLAAGD
jgi:thimet oligopeptidase